MKRTLFFLPLILLLFTGFQLFKTSLRITVLNDLGNVESEAVVKVYKTEEDYAQGVHVVKEGKTDKKGVVTFQDLEAIPYFISAEKGDMNNVGAGEKTEALETGKLNRINVIISE